MRRMVAIGVVWGVLLGCPARGRPTAPEPPASGAPEARQRFDAARARLGEGTTAAADFEAIARDYPDDPIAPLARLYAATEAYADERYEACETLLLPVVEAPAVPENTRAWAALLLGLSLEQLERDGAEALRSAESLVRTLEPDESCLARLPCADLRVQWLAAEARILERSAEPLAALPYLDRWYAEAREVERPYVREREQKLIAAANLEALQVLWARAPESLPSRAELASAIARQLRAQGSVDADRFEREAVALRRKAGIVEPIERSAHVVAELVGALFPLSGKLGLPGQAALRGVALASRTFAASGQGPSGWVSMRDTTRSDLAQAVRELEGEGVIAVVGALRPKRAAEIGTYLQGSSVLQISLQPRPGNHASGLRIVHSAEERARTAAAYAREQGAQTFALLSVESGYGRAVGRAFEAEVIRGGGSIMAQAAYAGNTTSFRSVIEALLRPCKVDDEGAVSKCWDAIFVADSAQRLALIAPALAAANLASLPRGESAPEDNHPILLLSTAEGLTPSFLASAGRYTWGAVLAPGFYPDEHDPLIGGFVRAYRDAYGAEPGAIEAYAYDAVQVVRAQVARGAHTRSGVAQAVRVGETAGVTGTLRFSSEGGRADPGVLFRVERDRRGTVVIAAIR